MNSSLRFGWWNRGRRRQVLVGFQSRYITVQLAWTLVLLLGFAALRIVPPLVGLDGASEAARLERATQFLHIHETLWVSLGALAAALTALSISLSHRVAGPLYRFRKVFEAVQQGDLAVSTRLRAGDYLMAEREELERMLDTLRQRIGRAQRAASAGRLATDVDEARAHLAAVEEALRPFVTEPAAAPGPAGPTAARPRAGSEAGLSIVELVMVIALILILSAIAIPRYVEAVENAKVTRAIGDLKTIDREIGLLKAQHGCLPSSLAGIDYIARTDPWGRPYSYQVLRTGDGTGGSGGSGGGKTGKTAGSGSGGAGGKPTASCAACNGQCVGIGQARKDQNLVPINSDFDLFSVGRDGASVSPLSGPGRDDIVRGSDGAYFGLAKDY